MGSWVPSLLGGPWRWSVIADPVRAAAPAALEIVATIIVVLAQRPSAAIWPGRGALAILLAQLTVTYLALVFGRGLPVGALAGLICATSLTPFRSRHLSSGWH